MICDILMPRKDGIEVLRALRALSDLLPIIMMAGESHRNQSIDLDYLRFARRLGATRTIEKPFRPSALVKLALASIRHAGGPAPH